MEIFYEKDLENLEAHLIRKEHLKGAGKLSCLEVPDQLLGFCQRSTLFVMSSLLNASEFDPVGAHYASAITALDTHKIRVQSTAGSTLATAFALDKGHHLTSISWGISPNVDAKSQKKKRRLSTTNINIESQVLNVGLNKGSILIYSPTAGEVVGKLNTPSSSSINDYHFSNITNSGWSVDASQTIIEWDTILFTQKQHFKFNESINLIRVIEYKGKPHLLLASHSVFIVDIATKETVKTFPGHISPIHTILPINNDSAFITAAHGDRFINIYSLESTSSVLVAQSNVLSVSFDKSNLTAVTEDGVVEVFNDPLSKPVITNSKRKTQQSKQSSAKIQLQRPNGDKVTIDNTYASSTFIVITWLEEGSIPYFERVKVQDITESTIIQKSKPAIQARDHSLFGQDIAAPKSYNESSATVTSGDNFRHLNNKEVQSDEEPDFNEEDGPSLAERLDSLKVESTLPKKKKGRATTGSMAVMLTQALRSNDHGILESLLSNRDENTLKGTVQRLDSSFAVVLLERLAERIARNTNRQGQLIIWVKWVMIIHGGYLVNMPNLTKSLSSLHSTLTRRANTLQRLLELQGKLDVLFSQQELNKVTNDQVEEDNDSEDSDVEYIEELDDGHLIDDAEQDFHEETEDGFMELDDVESSEEEIEIEVDDEKPVNDEEGFSDEEVQGNGFLEESDSENEQELLKQRIQKLQAKQKKHKN